MNWITDDRVTDSDARSVASSQGPDARRAPGWPCGRATHRQLRAERVKLPYALGISSTVSVCSWDPDGEPLVEQTGLPAATRRCRSRRIAGAATSMEIRR